MAKKNQRNQAMRAPRECVQLMYWQGTQVKPDECFNDAMLKPFFVAGCMSEIRSLVKDYEARTSKTDTVTSNKPQPTLSKLPPESTTKTVPAITQPQMPACANYCPVTTHAAKMPANAVSAPTM